MHPEGLLLGGGWRKGGISCWRAGPAECGKTVQLESNDRKKGRGTERVQWQGTYMERGDVVCIRSVGDVARGCEGGEVV